MLKCSLEQIGQTFAVHHQCCVCAAVESWYQYKASSGTFIVSVQLVVHVGQTSMDFFFLIKTVYFTECTEHFEWHHMWSLLVGRSLFALCFAHHS